jgi:serine protease Do
MGVAVARLILAILGFVGCALAAPWTVAGQADAVHAPALRVAAARGLSATVTVYGIPGLERHSCGDDDDDAGDAEPAGPMEQSLRVGSGFVLDRLGHVVTAAHVVEGCDRVIVKVSDGRVAEAMKVGADARADVAVLKLPFAPAAPVLGPSRSLRPGDWVLAVGHPFGLGRAVSAGIVSATSQFLPGEGELPFLQVDATLSPGSSGGPLVNRWGAVVGMNSRVIAGLGGGPGICLSVPIELVLAVAEELKQGRRQRTLLGAEFGDLPPPIAVLQGRRDANGALVTAVADGSVAQRLGLRRGDVIVRMNGKPISSGADLALVLIGWRKVPGTALVVLRGRRIVRLQD